MGRLIDADALLDRISLNYNNHQNITAGAMKDMINTTPTAYDTEKVVAELESFVKLAEDRWVNGTSNYAYQEHKCWVKAIDIVRKGGVE